MEVKELLENFSRAEYLATDGNWYKLSQVYPIMLLGTGDPNIFYLDTGGQMQDCDFFQAKLVGSELHRLFDNGMWGRISPGIRLQKEEDE